ncbi:sigma factor-like helix-turn-helix DNA-binding protein [Mycobacterium uberis]|uniref:sigma factor-like helix-turn-helix DNA-binding protein n=1 Tax=Mycobacterium uberis TaxID=2162698 RepID=UPI001FB542B1|nr:sigma factor-like helix-turn-helix DNA-binding protein [Mycobacterium uberis]
MLREVFCFSYDDIADLVGKPAPTVRQVGHRARKRIHAAEKIQHCGFATQRGDHHSIPSHGSQLTSRPW